LRVNDGSNVPMVLCGNKCDIPAEREVSTDVAKELARQWNIPFFETSAKERINVEEAFYQLVREVKNFGPEVERRGRSNSNGCVLC